MHILLNDTLQTLLVFFRTTFLNIMLLQRVLLEFVGMYNLLTIKLQHPVTLQVLIAGTLIEIVERAGLLSLCMQHIFSKGNIRAVVTQNPQYGRHDVCLTYYPIPVHSRHQLRHSRSEEHYRDFISANITLKGRIYRIWLGMVCRQYKQRIVIPRLLLRFFKEQPNCIIRICRNGEYTWIGGRKPLLVSLWQVVWGVG